MKLFVDGPEYKIKSKRLKDYQGDEER